MCVVAIGIDRVLRDFYVESPYPVFIFNGITSSLLFILTRIKRISDRAVLNLGLVYEILMCLSVSMGFTWVHYQTTGTPPAVTWVCIVLVAYPLIIPTAPRRTFVTAVIAAGTVPLGLVILESFGWVTPRPFDYVDVSIDPAFCVFLAVMGSRVIYGLNIEVARARQMGSYQLVELLGRGGMGEVWRAKHRLLARPAAVKLVRPEIQSSGLPADNERVLERFGREAQVTAGLESPNTVSLYDFGTTDEGVFYYVMEILCGRRARDYDVLKVLDFGLVALRPEARRDDARLTVEGQMGGTPAYMPPETVNEEQVDARADIYALGCVAYWLLTGQLVFEAATPMKTALAHVSEVPVAPSQRTEIEIPVELERLILACLEKEPSRRPQSASDLADELRACGLASAWTQERAREWWELHQPNVAQQRDSE
jgi:serine/threonine-protein kinase